MIKAWMILPASIVGGLSSWCTLGRSVAAVIWLYTGHNTNSRECRPDKILHIYACWAANNPQFKSFRVVCSSLHNASLTRLLANNTHPHVWTQKVIGMYPVFYACQREELFLLPRLIAHSVLHQYMKPELWEVSSQAFSSVYQERLAFKSTCASYQCTSDYHRILPCESVCPPSTRRSH